MVSLYINDSLLSFVYFIPLAILQRIYFFFSGNLTSTEWNYQNISLIYNISVYAFFGLLLILHYTKTLFAMSSFYSNRNELSAGLYEITKNVASIDFFMKLFLIVILIGSLLLPVKLRFTTNKSILIPTDSINNSIETLLAVKITSAEDKDTGEVDKIQSDFTIPMVIGLPIYIIDMLYNTISTHLLTVIKNTWDFMNDIQTRYKNEGTKPFSLFLHYLFLNKLDDKVSEKINKVLDNVKDIQKYIPYIDKGIDVTSNFFPINASLYIIYSQFNYGLEILSTKNDNDTFYYYSKEKNNILFQYLKDSIDFFEKGNVNYKMYLTPNPQIFKSKLYIPELDKIDSLNFNIFAKDGLYKTMKTHWELKELIYLLLLWTKFNNYDYNDVLYISNYSKINSIIQKIREGSQEYDVNLYNLFLNVIKVKQNGDDIAINNFVIDNNVKNQEELMKRYSNLINFELESLDSIIYTLNQYVEYLEDKIKKIEYDKKNSITNSMYLNIDSEVYKYIKRTYFYYKKWLSIANDLVVNLNLLQDFINKKEKIITDLKEEIDSQANSLSENGNNRYYFFGLINPVVKNIKEGNINAITKWFKDVTYMNILKAFVYLFIGFLFFISFFLFILFLLYRMLAFFEFCIVFPFLMIKMLWEGTVIGIFRVLFIKWMLFRFYDVALLMGFIFIVIGSKIVDVLYYYTGLIEGVTENTATFVVLLISAIFMLVYILLIKTLYNRLVEVVDVRDSIARSLARISDTAIGQGAGLMALAGVAGGFARRMSSLGGAMLGSIIPGVGSKIGYMAGKTIGKGLEAGGQATGQMGKVAEKMMKETK